MATEHTQILPAPCTGWSASTEGCVRRPHAVNVVDGRRTRAGKFFERISDLHEFSAQRRMHMDTASTSLP
jgi:hypothetical protein